MNNISLAGRLSRPTAHAADVLRSQARSVAAGGIRIFLWKVFLFLGLGLAVLPLLVIRLIRPLAVIRFASLYSHSIGPFCAITEIYLCERDAGMHGHRVLDLFCHQPVVCNQQLKKMWNRTLRVSQLVYPLDKLNRLLPGGAVHTVPWHVEDDIHGLLAGSPSHLSFTPDEEIQGSIKLSELGIPDGNPFVCFHSRDSAYLEATYPGGDLTDRDYRDSSIQNYLPAAKALVQRGYFAVRMGAIVKEPLSSTHPKIIDYATTGRTDFLDIYLSAKCSFFICSATGLQAVPMLFRRPIVLVNVTPLDTSYIWMPCHLILPKKLWSRDENRCLTFAEIIRLEQVMVAENLRLRFGLQYAERRIEVIENTAEEIAAVALEMDERLKGTWEPAEEDAVLQDRFWSLFERKALKRDGDYISRVGAEYLRQNRELLD